jgi:hypothetical protein
MAANSCAKRSNNFLAVKPDFRGLLVKARDLEKAFRLPVTQSRVRAPSAPPDFQ